MVLHSNITFQQQLILGKDVPWLGSFFSSIQSIKPENSTTTCYICIHKYNLYTYNTCSILTHCNDAVSQHCLGSKLLIVWGVSWWCHLVNIPMENICEQMQNIYPYKDLLFTWGGNVFPSDSFIGGVCLQFVEEEEKTVSGYLLDASTTNGLVNLR